MQRDVDVVIDMGGIGRTVGLRIGSGTDLIFVDCQKAALQELAVQMRGDGFSVHVTGADILADGGAIATINSGLSFLHHPSPEKHQEFDR